MDSLLPVGVAVVSLGLTYFMCIRPMRRGHGMMPGTKDSYEIGGSREESAEIARLRTEVARPCGENQTTTRRSGPTPGNLGM